MTDKEQDGVLLTPGKVNAILDKSEHKEDAYNSAVHELLVAQLAKAREAVEGAGLTPQEVQDSYHSTPELLERAKEYYGDTIEYFDATQLACRWSVAEAQTKAILKALEGE